MSCRHSPDDSACSSHPSKWTPERRAREHADALDRARRIAASGPGVEAPAENSPDPDDYEVEDALEVAGNLVLRVRYPSCERCAYEGSKVLVFVGTTVLAAIRWRRIDPHFREDVPSRPPTEAPSPAARFPASGKGWEDALAYARSKRDDR